MDEAQLGSLLLLDVILAGMLHLAPRDNRAGCGLPPEVSQDRELAKLLFDNTISKLDEAGLLFQVLERFKNVDLHPNKVDNATIGTIFKELIREFNEALNAVAAGPPDRLGARPSPARP